MCGQASIQNLASVERGGKAQGATAEENRRLKAQVAMLQGEVQDLVQQLSGSAPSRARAPSVRRSRGSPLAEPMSPGMQEFMRSLEPGTPSPRPAPATPLPCRAAAAARPPATVLRLRTQCRELDSEVSELDADNSHLRAEVAQLKGALQCSRDTGNELTSRTEQLEHELREALAEAERRRVSEERVCDRLAAYMAWELGGAPTPATLHRQLVAERTASAALQARAAMLEVEMAAAQRRVALAEATASRAAATQEQLVEHHRRRRVAAEADADAAEGRCRDLQRQLAASHTE